MPKPSPREVIDNAAREGRAKLLEHEAYALIEQYGVPIPRIGLAKNPEEAGVLADKVGYPVVLKIVSPDIVHKSDVGGVVLDLKSREEVVKAAEAMLMTVRSKAPTARICGVLVQNMVPQGVEVIVGGLRDNVFDAVVMFGIGGIFVEVLRDVSFRVAPITVHEALEMISEVKAKKILEGYRNNPPVDKKALAEIVVAVSRILLENPEIHSIDLNPVMAYPSGAIVADARIMLRKEQVAP